MALKIVSLRQLASSMAVDQPKPETPPKPSEVMTLMNLQSALEGSRGEAGTVAQPEAAETAPEFGEQPVPAAAPLVLPLQATVPAQAIEIFAGRRCDPRMREGFRKLRNRLEEERIIWKEAGVTLRSVTVLSGRRGDGRSVTARNLAACLGSVPELRTLLVDADVVNPSAVRRFSIQRSPGFAEALEQSGSEWLGWTSRVEDSGLYVLPLGVSSTRASVDGLSYQNLPAFLETARQQFEWVVFDAPSLESADAEILSRMTDGSLVVLRAGSTYFDEASAAVRRIQRAKLLGTVLGQTR